METILRHIVAGLPFPVLLAIIGILIYTLGKGADFLVDEAVNLSLKWNVPKIFIGVTIVSLGTTVPEAAVSVMAAINGEPGIALGNAVGSVICDTGLILGLAATMTPLPLGKSIIRRQGWIQLLAGFLLVISCIPFFSSQSVFVHGGNLPRFMGFVFLLLLAGYFFISFYWIQSDKESGSMVQPGPGAGNIDESTTRGIIMKMAAGILLVLVSSRLLIPAVYETALRLSVPESIIGATLVAFGTSLPELVTAITAVRKGYGELAVGNVIGADILNILFVAGAAASVTRGGLIAPVHFFQLLFPAMLFILVVFRVGILFSNGTLKRPFGIVLMSVYFFVSFFSYAHYGL